MIHPLPPQLLVTAVIPAYNCAPYIGNAIESVLNQSYRSFELIVVDDGSTDTTASVARRYREVTYVLQPNGGPSRARNTGIRRARGEFVAFLDADDVWPPEKLAEQLDVLASCPDAALVFGDMRRFSDDGATEPSMFERYGLGRDYFGDDTLVIKAVNKLLTMNFVPTGTVLARTHCIDAVGLFDETFRMAEDWDLWLRLALRYPIAYSSKLWKLKRVHDNNVSRQTAAMTEAALTVMQKLRTCHHADLDRLGVDIGRHLRSGYQNLGYLYLRELRLPDARRALVQSLAWGVNVRPLIYLLSTCFGPRILGRVLRWRGSAC